MGKKVLTFEDIEIEKVSFTAITPLFFLKDLDVEKVFVSNKIPFGVTKL